MCIAVISFIQRPCPPNEFPLFHSQFSQHNKLTTQMILIVYKQFPNDTKEKQEVSGVGKQEVVALAQDGFTRDLVSLSLMS